MTVILGYAWAEGAFLAADTRRRDHVFGTQTEKRKLLVWRESVLVAFGGPGTRGSDPLWKALCDDLSIGDSLDDLMSAGRTQIASIFRDASAAWQRDGLRVPPLWMIAAGQESDGGFAVKALVAEEVGTYLPRVSITPLISRNAPFSIGPRRDRIREIAAEELPTDAHLTGRSTLDGWAQRVIRRVAIEHPNDVAFPVDAGFITADKAPVLNRLGRDGSGSAALNPE